MAQQSRSTSPATHSPQQLRESLAALTPEQRQQVLRRLPEDAVRVLTFDWRALFARPSQVEPDGDWSTWLILAGRGFGKTRCGAEWVRERVNAGAKRIALVAATAADARDTMVEGVAGILATSPPWNRPKYEPSKRRLTWPNGAIATAFSADEAERLRGPQHDTAWCDELAAWRYAQDAWDMLQFGMRLGKPRVCVTTTPRATKLIRELSSSPSSTVTRGSTFENERNLAPEFIAKIRAKYEGTRLGRQELFAEILDDTPGALWTRATLERAFVRAAPTDLRRIVIGVDPSVGDGTNDEQDEAGIVAVGLGHDRIGYVLQDASLRGSPNEWAAAAVALYDLLRADAIVAEANQGGEMVRAVIHTVDSSVNVRLVHASRGKSARAEPIASLYEQGRMRHVGSLAKLEDEMCTWSNTTGEPSPNRIDALVHGLTEFLLELTAPDELTSSLPQFRARMPRPRM